MSGRLFVACAIMAAAALIVACLAAGAPALAGISAGLAAVCLLAARRQRHAIAQWTAVGMAAVSGVAVLYGASPGLALIAAVASLGAWDLSGRAERVAGAPRVDDIAGMERSHTRWLAVTLAAGVGFAALAMSIRLSVSFALLVALGLAAYLALQRLAVRIRGRGG
jgi:hypothetical protein